MKQMFKLLLAAFAVGACAPQLWADSSGWLENLHPVPVDMPGQRNEVPRGVNVYLDRVIYQDRDKDGQGLVVINPCMLLLQGKLVDHTVKVWTEDMQGKPIGAVREAKVTDTDHFAFDLDIPAAALGQYKVVAALLDPEGKESFRGSRTMSIVKAPGEPAKRTAEIPLVLFDDPQLVDTQGIPISTGIPLPDGMLDDASQVSLLEDGKEIPVQAFARARWTRKGSIKWLGLDFQAGYASGEPKKYVLRIGTPPTAAGQAGGPVKLVTTDDSYTLDNGIAQVTVGRKSFRMFDKVMLDRNKNGTFEADEALVQAKETDGPYWVNAKGTAYRAALDKTVEVRIEESGPLRTSLRADGWLVAADGARAGKFTSRITLCAGQSQAQVNQTFIVTWDTEDPNMRVRDMGVAVSPVSMNKTMLAPYTPAKDLPAQGSYYMLVDRYNRVLWGQDPSANGKPLYSGTGEQLRFDRTTFLGMRYPLALGGIGDRGGIAVSQRYMAEKFPKEIELSKEALTWHAWPLHGTETFTDGTDISAFNYMRWLHQGQLLDFQIPAAYFDAVEKFKKVDASGSRVDLLMSHGKTVHGRGAAISGELMYYFSPETQEVSKQFAEVARQGVVFDSAPHAVADPKFAASTRVLELISPKSEKYPNIERGISNSFDRVKAITEDGKEYGQFVWPNGHDYYTPGWDYASLHRARVNAHHGSEMAGWQLYLRSGEKKYWHFARSFTRYTLDLATVNYGPYEVSPKLSPIVKDGFPPGSVFHCDGYVPWGPAGELMGHMAPQWQGALYYYMTGDSQAFDVINLTAQTVLKAVRTEQDFRVREPFQGLLNRNPLCGWAMITNLYAETHDPRLLRPVADIGSQIFNGTKIEFDGQPPHGQSGRWWWYTYNQQWRDPVAIKEIAEHSPDGTVSFAAYMIETWRQTGDPSGVYAFWAETLGMAPFRQLGMGHPQKYINLEPMSDNYNFILPLLGAMEELNLPEVPCITPISADTKTYAVFKKDADRAFTLKLWAVIQSLEGATQTIPFVVEGPSGKVVAQGEIDPKKNPTTPKHAVVVNIPADGLTGEYKLRFPKPSGICLVGPLSDLPKEVYVVPAGSYVWGTQLCWRTAADETRRTITPILKFGENYTTLFRLETPDGYFVQESADTLPIHMKVKPLTMYRLNFCQAGQTGYAWRWKGILPPSGLVSPGPDMILSADESRWFEPKAK